MEQEFLQKDLKKIAHGAKFSFLGNIFGGGLTFVVQILIARLYGPASFGLYVLGSMVFRITELLSMAGLQTGGMRFISLYKDHDLPRLKGTIISSVAVTFFNALFISTGIFLLSDFIAVRIFHNQALSLVIKIFSMGVPITSVMTIISFMTRGFHTTKYDVFISNIIQPVSNIVLILTLFFLGFNFESTIYAFILSHFIAIFFAIGFLYRLCPDLRQGFHNSIFEIRKLLLYSLPVMGSLICNFVVTWTDVFMLGFMVSLPEVGVYRVASQVPLSLTMILGAVNSIYGPVIASLFHHKEKERMAMVFKTTTRWIFIIALPLCLIIIFLAKEILLIFGRNFVSTAGITVLTILTIAHFINAVTANVGITLTMSGKQKIELFNFIAQALINIVLNLILIPHYGIIGAALAAAISILMVNAIRLFEVYCFYKMHPYSNFFSKYIIPTVLACLVAAYVNSSLVNGMVLKIIVNVFILSSVFLIFFKLIGLEEDKQMIKEVLLRIFAK